MQVIFLKEAYYRNKKYKKNDIIDISEIDVKAYLECKVVKLYVAIKKKLQKPLNELSYRELQAKCKNKRIPAVGTKEDLIISLTGCE
jgi:hypothetical protein